MPYMQVEIFVEMFEMEIVQQMGDEWHTTGPMPLGWSMCDMWFSLWRTKQSHFQPSVKMGMKNLDKNIDNVNKQLFGCLMQLNRL
jgi:hypothetical protein